MSSLRQGGKASLPAEGTIAGCTANVIIDKVREVPGLCARISLDARSSDLIARALHFAKVRLLVAELRNTCS